MRFLSRDLRFGLRILGRSPGFAAATVIILGLGIGANTAVFTVASAVLLRPLPYRHPEQLVNISAKDKAKDYDITLLRFELVRDLARSFEAVSVWTSDNLNLTGDGEPVQASIARVSPNFFTVLGVQPRLGRTFTDGEGRPDGKPVAILSNALWHSRFRGDLNVVGRTVALDSTPYTVVGVMPDDVQFPFVGPVDIWTPRYFEYSLMTTQHLRMGVGYLNMIGRLKSGTTLMHADTELEILNQRYRSQNPAAPDAGPGIVMTARNLHDLVVANVRTKLLFLSAAVAVVLLIACANVASLLLSRALGRKREIAIRAALGASRIDIVRQLLIESVLLSLAAGILGAILGWIATRTLAAWGADQLPQGIPLHIDIRVLWFTFGISLLAGVLFGFAPALQLAGVDLIGTLRDEGRGISMTFKRARTKSLLVVSQVALSLVLLIGAGLLLRSFVRLVHVNPGFESQNILTMNLSLPTTKYAKAEQQIAFFDELLRRVSALPGVRNAAISAASPLSWKRITPMLPEGLPAVPLAQRPFIDIEAISPGWLQTMQVPIRSGREFNEGDNAQAPKVVVVNSIFANQFWPTQNPLGKHIIIGRRPDPAEVIGVTADIKNKGLDQDPQPQIYIPFPQLPWGNMYLLVRTAIPPQQLIRTVLAQVNAMDSEQPVTEIRTVDEIESESRAQPRFLLLIVAAFSTTTLGLAVIGIFAVLAYSVSLRRHEFGIRLALGATRTNILRLVLRQGIFLATTGLAIGIVVSFFLTSLLSTMLYGVGPRDLTTFLMAPLVFLCVSLIASYLPALKATHVDPIETLR